MKDKYDDEYVINLIPGHAELNSQFGSLFVNQSQNEKPETETKMNTYKERNEKEINQSQTNRTFPNRCQVSKETTERNTFIWAV